MENNFTKAMKELLGDKGNNAQNINTNPPESEQQATNSSAPVNNNNVNNTTNDTGSKFHFGSFENNEDSNNSGNLNAFFESTSMPSNSQETYISKDTVIIGSITSKLSVNLAGQITGDISSESDIKISGKVDGNLDGNNVYITDGSVIGNVQSKGNVVADTSSVIIGDIASKHLDLDGRLKGNVKSSGGLSLKSNAMLLGSVATKSISVETGAVIRGNVQVQANKDIVNISDDLFTSKSSPFDNLD